MFFELDEEVENYAKMKVVGVGGAGGNAVNRMIDADLNGVEFVSVNTDLQALETAKATNRIQIGGRITKGLGAGSDPVLGKKAIDEDRDLVAEGVAGADMVFITAGMGGGTGTGASPIVAEIARQNGALTIGVVTKPFDFEGKKRMSQALSGIEELKERVDTLIVIPNQRLLSIVTQETRLTDAFRMADEVLLNATRGISDVITVPGLINLDFADVRTVMSEMGEALMGVGVANGENRAREAAERAVSSPLLDGICITGAKGLLVNITGGSDLTLYEVNEAATAVTEAAGCDAHVIFGAVIDEKLKDEMRITVIATGFGQREVKRTAESEDRIGDLFSSKKLVFERHSRSNQQVFIQNGKVKSITPDDLEVPTFLRKQAEG
jgi:cell division protein FtsZ